MIDLNELRRHGTRSRHSSCPQRATRARISAKQRRARAAAGRRHPSRPDGNETVRECRDRRRLDMTDLRRQIALIDDELERDNGRGLAGRGRTGSCE